MFTDNPEEFLAFGPDREPQKTEAEKRPCPGPEFCVPDRDRPWACRLCGGMIHATFDD